MATKSIEKNEKKTGLSKPNPESFSPLEVTPFTDIDRVFDEYFNRNWLRSLQPKFSRMNDLWGTFEMHSPNMDVIDRDKDILIRAELPGVEKKDIDISVTDNMITIKGESKYESKTKKDEYYSSEIKKGSFSRTVMLPTNIDSSKIKADLNNGLLEVAIPKTGKSKKVSVKVK